MSITWVAAFGLLVVVVGLEALALLAVMRQVGVLSMRIKPVPALEDDESGPEIGTTLPEISLDPTPRTAAFGDAAPFSAGKYSVLLFVAPTCRVCKPLLRPLERLQRHRPDAAMYLLADVDGGRADEYAERARVELPFYVAPSLLERWNVTGTPFVVVADDERRVLRAGVANTIEQVEFLLDAAAGTDEAAHHAGITEREEALLAHRPLAVAATERNHDDA